MVAPEKPKGKVDAINSSSIYTMRVLYMDTHTVHAKHYSNERI